MSGSGDRYYNPPSTPKEIEMAGQLTRQLGYDGYRELPAQLGPEKYQELMDGRAHDFNDGPEPRWDEGRMRGTGEYRELIARLRSDGQPADERAR